MLRELSAIGMSKWTGQQAAGRLIADILSEGRLKGRHYRQDGQIKVELIHDMGPFQLVLRGNRRGEHEVTIESVTPALKEKRAYLLLEPEIFLGEGGLLYLEGAERESLETMTLCLTEICRCMQEGEAINKSPYVLCSCYGISTEGKVLLGIERTEEDLALIKEETEARRSMLKKAREGDAGARDAIRRDEFGDDEEVMDRLRDEDVYSILDGFYYPAERDENCFTLLGDIKTVDKLLNPWSEEWVYYLELDVLGQTMRVLIHPNDLLGEPAVGRRFRGKVRFYGRLDPARLILENQNGFY